VDLVSAMKKSVESFELPHFGGVNNVGFDRIIFYAREADELEQTERAKTFYFDVRGAS